MILSGLVRFFVFYKRCKKENELFIIFVKKDFFKNIMLFLVIVVIIFIVIFLG